MSPRLQFTKMQVQGNDFIIIDGIKHTISLDPNFIKKIADRHFGVGCDQFLLIESSNSKSNEFKYRIFNADGSEVGQCGNGARAVAWWLKHHNYIIDHCVLKTINTNININIKNDLIEVTVPIVIKPEKKTYMFNGRNQSLVTVDLGNPHAVIITEHLNTVELLQWGEYLNKHQDFPHGINVSFLQILNENNAQLQVFERGVGITKSCGSGAVAAAIAGIFLGKLASAVNITQSGGLSTVVWKAHSHPVISGDARLVFTGELDIMQFTA